MSRRRWYVFLKSGRMYTDRRKFVRRFWQVWSCETLADAKSHLSEVRRRFWMESGYIYDARKNLKVKA